MNEDEVLEKLTEVFRHFKTSGMSLEQFLTMVKLAWGADGTLATPKAIAGPQIVYIPVVDPISPTINPWDLLPHTTCETTFKAPNIDFTELSKPQKFEIDNAGIVRVIPGSMLPFENGGLPVVK